MIMAYDQKLPIGPILDGCDDDTMFPDMWFQSYSFDEKECE